MDRRTRNLFALALVAIMAIAGSAAMMLGGGRLDAPGPDRSVTGVIVGIESEGLDRVRGFNLRTDDGATIEFEIGTLENAAAFPPGHLAEHQATGQRIRVWYGRRGQANVAVRLDDAP